jgi:ABC-2 type transport system permease protein
MNAIRLIAWREYKQYVFSRGFLLFLVLFPMGMVLIGGAMGLLERSKPTRHFVVYDETGLYTDDIDREIARRHLRLSINLWDLYLSVNAEAEALEAGSIPAPFSAPDLTDRRLSAFEEAGGFDAAAAAAAPFLKPGAPAFTQPKQVFRRIALPPDAAAATSLALVEEALRPYLLEQRRAPVSDDGDGAKLFAAILIPKTFGAGEDAAPAQYWSRNLTDQALEAIVTSALNSALQRQAIIDFGLPQEALDEVAEIDAPVSAFRPDRAPGKGELGMKDRIETALPAVLTYMLLIIIFGVGNLLLTNTIEERSNKIVEILLSSVTANQLMMGKLIGIAAVGLTMPTIFLLGGLGTAIAAGGDGNIMGMAFETLFSTNLLLVYVFYFLCAYLIFSTIFLAIGAVSNSLQDAQSYMGPVMLLVFAPLPFMILVFENPNGLVASILTWIPIYTPYAVMMRAAASPPMWEILGATALMLAFTIFLIRIMGRIFRQAILQAAPPKIREVWKLARKETA